MPGGRRVHRRRHLTLLASFLVLGLILSGCHGRGTDETGSPASPPSASATASAPASATPTPTPVVFAQDFSGDIDGDTAEVSISDEATGKKFRSENIGVSFEATELADPRLDPDASNLADMLKRLGSPALRFGGNKLDRSTFWTSSGERPPKPDQIIIGPDDLARLKKLVDRTGSTVTLGIPLGTYDPDRGADMAAHAVDILGDSLVGLAIGNEPNGYTVTDVPGGAVRKKGWSTKKYVKQLEAYATAIHKRAPTAPIIGPDVYDGAWMQAFSDSTVTHKAALSQHWYQLYDCDSRKVPGRGPEAANLVDPLAKKSTRRILGIGKKKAAAAKLPLWLEETGTTSCPGTNDVSLTHASALWAVDYSFTAAKLGVQRMAMHSMLGACKGGAPMSLICDPADYGSTSSTFRGRPHFAGLSLLVPSTGGDILKTSVSGGGNLSVYAVDQEEKNSIVVTVVNANDAAHSGGNPVSLRVPQGYRAVRASQIHGPSNDAVQATEVTPVAPLPKNLPYSGPAAAAGRLTLDLAASSATVIIFERDD